jgi:hypothetical protein
MIKKFQPLLGVETNYMKNYCTGSSATATGAGAAVATGANGLNPLL